MIDPNIKERVLQCPHCQGMMLLQVRTEVEGVEKCSEDEVRAQKDFGPELKEFLIEIEKTGLIEVFGKTARYVHGDQCPKDLVRFFTNCARSVVIRNIPRFALDCIVESFPPVGRLQFWQSNGIGFIVLDNALRGFVPVSLVIGQRARDLESGERYITIPPHAEELFEWFSDDGVKLNADQWISFLHLRKICT